LVSAGYYRQSFIQNMVKSCASGICNTDARFPERLEGGIRFFPFVSGERGFCSGVVGGCNMLSWFPWLFSRKSLLGAESWSSSDMLQSVCGELCGQGSAEILSMSRSCCSCTVLLLSLCDMSTACPFRS